LSARIFDPGIAYVALGHLHLAQTINGDETRRYCGSPLPMSFSEIDYKHQVVVIELDGDKVIEIPRAVVMLKVPKRPAPLTEALAELHALSLTDNLNAGLSAEFGPELWPYLQVRVQVSQPEPTLRAQVEAALAGKPVRLVRIETTTINAGNNLPAPEVSVDELSQLDPADYFERLYFHKYGEPVPAAIKTAFSELLDASAQEGLPT
jgi:exonuclease SbcD